MNASWVIRVGLSAIVVIGGLVYFAVTRDEDTALRKRGAAVEKEQWRSGEPGVSHSDPIANAPVQVLDESTAPLANVASVEAFAMRFHEAMTPEFLAEFTKGRGQTAENLVFATLVSGDTSYLYRAASLFPDSPQVQLHLARLGGSQDRIAALAAFRKLDPGNAIGDFLAAQQGFEAGDSAAAVKAIWEGVRKSEFHEYESQLMRTAANAYLSAGFTGIEATVGSLFQNSPQMRRYAMQESMKGLLAKQKEEGMSGATGMADSSIFLGLSLSRFYEAHANSAFTSLHAATMELQALQLLPESTLVHDGVTVQSRKETLKATVDEINAFEPILEAKMKTLTSSGINEYARRVKESGEVEALRWLRDSGGADN